MIADEVRELGRIKVMLGLVGPVMSLEHRGKPLTVLMLEVAWVLAESLVLSGELNGGVQEGEKCWKAVAVWQGRGGGSLDRVEAKRSDGYGMCPGSRMVKITWPC